MSRTPDRNKKQAQRQRNRRAKRRAEGMCIDCGVNKPQGYSHIKRKPFITCDTCRSTKKRYAQARREAKAKKPAPPELKINDHPRTTTGKSYSVKKTGQTGVIVPCPCPDPIILQFSDGFRDAFHLKDCIIL